MATRGSFAGGPQGPPGNTTGPAGGDLGGTYPNPTLQPTPAVEAIIQANRLDQMAAPTAAVSLGGQKLTNVANGVLSTDAMNISQIPTALPPSGSAGGDLTGTYPNPTLTATTNVNNIIRATTINQLAPAQGSVNLNNNKITNVQNGTAPGDAINFGQIPGALPPNGAASGDLSGTYPSPSVAKVNGISASGTPAYGQVLAANSSTAATWQITPGLMSSTGIISGGNYTINGTNPAAFDIVQTVGYIADYTTSPTNPTITKVTIPAQTVVISGTALNNAINWWVSDANGVITSVGPNRPTDTQRRTMIQLGSTASVVGTGQIVTVAPAPAQLVQTQNQLFDFMYSLGPFVVGGAQASNNGANLTFQTSAGEAFFPNFASALTPNDPHTVIVPAGAPAQFRYSTQLAGSETGPLVSSIDPSHYDNNGVVTLIPSGGSSATIQRIWLFGTGVAATQLLVQYGQVIYTNLANAQSGLSTERHIVNPDFAGVGTLLGWLIVIKSATDLSNTAQASFVPAGKFAKP